jgi:hypothetical protein
MGASLSTIKKRFRGIYEKVQDKIGDVRSVVPFVRCNEGARGLETRRRLLKYLREHPEELRPYGANPRVSERAGLSSAIHLPRPANGVSLRDESLALAPTGRSGGTAG